MKCGKESFHFNQKRIISVEVKKEKKTKININEKTNI